VDPETNEVGDMTFVEKADAERFSRTGNPEHGPSIGRFEIDLAMPHSDWNKRLSTVFAEDFIKSELYGFGPEDEEDVKEAFLVHVRTVRRHITSRQGKSVIDQLDQTKASARNMRRRNVGFAHWNLDYALADFYIADDSLPESLRGLLF